MLVAPVQASFAFLFTVALSPYDCGQSSAHNKTQSNLVLVLVSFPNIILRHTPSRFSRNGTSHLEWLVIHQVIPTMMPSLPVSRLETQFFPKLDSLRVGKNRAQVLPVLPHYLLHISKFARQHLYVHDVVKCRQIFSPLYLSHNFQDNMNQQFHMLRSLQGNPQTSS